jgi:DNA-directed RNA polymerase subunit omega
LIYPAGDAIRERVNNRYSLVVLAAKRAKQIKEGSPVLIDTASTNPLTIALEEIAVGKVTYTEATEPIIDDEAAIAAEPRISPSLVPGHDFLSVSPSTAIGNEPVAGSISPELAAFLPPAEIESHDEGIAEDTDSNVEEKSLESTEKAQL